MSISSNKMGVYKGLLLLSLAIFIFVFGIKPMLTKPEKKEIVIEIEKEEIKLKKDNNKFDVIVIGGRADAISAALSSSREGLSTLLILPNSEKKYSLENTLDIDKEISYGIRGETLNKGIFKEIFTSHYDEFSFEEYHNNINNLISDENELEILKDLKIDTISTDDNRLKSISIIKNETKYVIEASMFIDSTKNGTVLELLNVEYSSGAEDINLKNLFSPIKLNFKLEKVNFTKLNEVLKTNKNIYVDTSVYLPRNDILKVNKIFVERINKQNTVNINHEDGSEFADAIVSGIEVLAPNILDENEMAQLYELANEEIKHYLVFLKSQYESFNESKLIESGKSFIVKENRHYKGEYKLTVSDMLDNKDFEDKIAVSSYQIGGKKFTNNGSDFVIGKPIIYSVPLGSVIPKNLKNVLMTGEKISVSSIGSSSVSSRGTRVAIGNSLGVIAKVCIEKGITLQELYYGEDKNIIKDIKKSLVNRGIYLPNISEYLKFASSKVAKNKNIEYLHKWSYEDIKKLCDLGLIAGGIHNNFRVEEEATQEEFISILINGISRISGDSEEVKLKEKFSKFMTTDKLTKDSVVKILGVLYGLKSENGLYKKLYDKGYISELIKLALNEKNTLKMEYVYNLSTYTLLRYTGN